MEEETQNWSSNLNKEKQIRLNAENEIILLKSTLKVTNDKISELNNEIHDKIVIRSNRSPRAILCRIVSTYIMSYIAQ